MGEQRGSAVTVCRQDLQQRLSDLQFCQDLEDKSRRFFMTKMCLERLLVRSMQCGCNYIIAAGIIFVRITPPHGGQLKLSPQRLPRRHLRRPAEHKARHRHCSRQVAALVMPSSRFSFSRTQRGAPRQSRAVAAAFSSCTRHSLHPTGLSINPLGLQRCGLRQRGLQQRGLQPEPGLHPGLHPPPRPPPRPLPWPPPVQGGLTCPVNI